MAATSGTLAMNDAPLSTRATTVLAASLAANDTHSPFALTLYRSEAMNVDEWRGLAARLRELMIT
jgi:hypothetical protein